MEIRRLTRGAYIATGPRFDRPACPTCPLEVVYARRSPEGFPSLNRIALDGSPPRELTRRYLGSTTAIGDGDLYFDQQEIRRNTGIYSDIYAWSRESGRVRRLTSEARLLDPDLSPDGKTLACVQVRPGRRDLVLLDVGRAALQSVRTLLSEPETQFNTPRWSPDGRSIAVERHRPGSSSEI